MIRRLSMVGFVVSVLCLTLAPLSAQPVAAENTRDIQTWVTLASTNPASGCQLDISVEVRSAGFAVPNVDVMVALSVDGEVLYADRGRTADDGLSFLVLDTGYASAGTTAYLDVVIAGEWITGQDLPITDDGPCADNAKVLDDTGKIWLPEPSTPSSAAVPALSGDVEGVSLEVPTYVQQRNLSCEYASLVIAMAYYGTWVSEYAFDELVGWSDNPHWGYRGNIEGWWGRTDDYGVYAEPLAPALEHFGFNGEVFYGNGDPAALMNRLDAGAPTLVWLGLWGDTSYVEYAEDGTPYLLAAGAHVVVARGYDEWGVYVSDPATGSYNGYDWDSFMAMWNVLSGMAIAVTPA